MKYLFKFNEHILSINDKSDHLFGDVSKLTSSDLQPGEIYKYQNNVSLGGKSKKVASLVKLDKIDDNENYHFKVVKVLTPRVGKLINLQRGDIIMSEPRDIPRYYSLV